MDKTNASKCDKESAAVSKGLDYNLIELLEKEFSFKKSMLADWLGVSRQRIYKMLETRSPRSQDCWTGKPFSVSEKIALVGMLTAKQFKYQTKDVKCHCFNNKQDNLVCIFVYSNEIKAYFMEDIPDHYQRWLKSVNMHRLTFSETEDLRDGKVVSILKENHFMPGDCGRFKANARKRNLSVDEYARLLSGYPYVSPKNKTDSDILSFFEQHCVNDRIYLSSDPSSQWIRAFASRNHIGINELIELYGYKSGTHGQGGSSDAARERHIEALQTCIIHDNVVYIPVDSRIYGALDAYSRLNGISLNQYVEKLGFVRTLEKPVSLQNPEESDMHSGIYLNVFFRYALLGSKIYSPEKIGELECKARKAIDRVLANSSTVLGGRTKRDITQVLIYYAREWNTEMDEDLWQYIVSRFAYRDQKGKVVKILQDAMEESLTLTKKLFVKDRRGRAFKTTILIHAFAPKQSWIAMYDFLFNFYKNNLHWQYVPDDPLVGSMVEALRARFDGTEAADISMRTNYNISLFQEGVRKLVLYRPLYARKLFDQMLSNIDGLIKAKRRPVECYVDVLALEWYHSKLRSMSEAGQQRQRRKKAEIATSYTRIRIRYVLENDSEVFLLVPDIRLKGQNFRRADAIVSVHSVPTKRIHLNWYGNEFGKTIQGTMIPISAGFGTISLQITCDDEIIYDSGDKLHRDRLIFSQGKEVQPKSMGTGDYTLLLPETVEVTFENAEVQEIPDCGIAGFRAYFVELQDQFVLCAGQDFTIADQEYGNLRILLPPKCETLPKLIVGDEEFQIAKSGSIITIVLDKEEFIKCYRIYKDDVQISKRRGSNLESHILMYGDECRIRVFDIVRDRKLYDQRFALASKVKARFNREFYFSQSDYEDALLTLKIDDIFEKKSFTQETDELCTPFRNGKLRITVPKIRLEETTGTWLDDPAATWWIGDIPQKSFVKVTSPNGVSVCFSVAKKTVQCDSKGMAAVGNMLYSVNPAETQSAGLMMIVQGQKKKQRYLLGKVFFQEGFIQPPRFWLAGRRLYWDGGEMFIGKPDQKLTLTLTDQQEYSFPLSPQTTYLDIPEMMQEGIYHYTIVMEKSMFKKRSICLAEGSCPIGDPECLRFVKRRIRIDEITDINVPGQHVGISPCYIDNIHFLRREWIASEKRECSVYSGIMFTLSDGGKRTNFSFADDESHRCINPVRIVYINDTALDIKDPDGRELRYDRFYDNSKQAEICSITDTVCEAASEKRGNNSVPDLYLYRIEDDDDV